ncbi:MAG: DUF4910 domain-containing protein [Actinomycetota bacterium]|nr:DUF4910 domain-containing protein [Actinomycetota bacterium]
MQPESNHAEGLFAHALAERLWDFPRSLTGDGVRATFAVLQELLPELVVHEVPSGTEVFDWVVPDEWNIREAYLIDPHGHRVIDFAFSNLHVVGYSDPVDTVLTLDELQPHLHSDPEHPDVIPYVTNYYNPGWGLCLPHALRLTLEPGDYRVVIDSTLAPGSLTYGELLIPGDTEDEVFISTYICHPSLANNELSGPVVSVAIARWLMGLARRRYTYRLVFVPETIGAITYLARNLEHLKSAVVSGYNLTCIGDEGDYSYLQSRRGGLPIDRIARRAVLATPQPKLYSYLDRGSDERQYGAPGVDLPLISLMRTKYGSYPQYHSSADDLSFVTPAGLQGGIDLVRTCISEFEESIYYRTPVLGEPQLGKRGLYHQMHGRTVEDVVLLRTHVLAYADGQHSVTDMAELFERPLSDVQAVVAELLEHGLLEEVPPMKGH